VGTLRTQIQSTFGATDAAEQRESGMHKEAETIATKTQDRSPKPRAGQDLPQSERDKKIDEAAETLTKEQPERKEQVAEEIRKRPFTVVPESWPGSEIFEIEHLGSNAIVKLNMRHPFYQEVYRPLADRIDGSKVENATEEERALARLAQVGLDLLILAYARAEGARRDAPDYYSDLRTGWGMHLKNMVQEWKLG
jgi:hypothetical protein